MAEKNKKLAAERLEWLDQVLGDPDVGRFYNSEQMEAMDKERRELRTLLGRDEDIVAPTPARKVGWTVMADGKMIVNQVGSSFGRTFPHEIMSALLDIMNQPGDCFATFERFSDSTCVLTVKSIKA